VTQQRRIHSKPSVYRRAVAQGELRLSVAGIRAVRVRRTEKGDPLIAGELAGLLALKRTHELLPHCHPIPITGSSVVVEATPRGVRARAEVEAIWKTGVEMEALVAVSVALLTVWDMVKYLEKNARGGYPRTRIVGIRVVAKEKSRWESPP
jgi:cyclic pyranopterin phosphate synthase